MVAKAVPDAVKRVRRRRSETLKLRDALQVWHEEREKPKKERKSIRLLACCFDVSSSTLNCHIKGGLSMLQCAASWQKLTVGEESVLVEMIGELADQGFPPTCERVKDMGCSILASRIGSSVYLGIRWVDWFLQCHEHKLQPIWSKPLDTLCANSLTEEAANDWFNGIVKRLYVYAGVEPENTDGMDESGFQLSDTGTQWVIGRRGTKRQHCQGGGDHEDITVITTICADGTALRPTLFLRERTL